MFLISGVSSLATLIVYIAVSAFILGGIDQIYNLGTFMTVVLPIIFGIGPICLRVLIKFGLFKRQNYLIWGMLVAIFGTVVVVLVLYQFVPNYSASLHEIYGTSAAAVTLGLTIAGLVGLLPLFAYVALMFALFNSKFLRAWDPALSYKFQASA